MSTNKNRIFDTYCGGTFTTLNKELHSKIDNNTKTINTKFNVRDFVEVEISQNYYNQQNSISNSNSNLTKFQGEITEIGTLTFERNDNYFKFNIKGFPFLLEEKYINNMKKVKKE